MTEPSINFKFSGWGALVVVIVLIAFLGIRITSMTQNNKNKKLIEKIKFELMTDYFPDDAKKLRALYDAGDMNKLSEAIESVTTTEINLRSVKISYSIFDFSTKKRNVVVKVDYSIDDTNGIRKQGTKYYLMEHRPMVNTWGFARNSYAWRYYLNFI